MRRPNEDYFDLQLRYAARFASLTGTSYAEGIARCTNLRRRFGLFGRSGEAAWNAFLREVDARLGHEQLLELALELHGQACGESASPFGCFSYELPDATGTLRLHFMPEERHRTNRPLSAARQPDRRAELHALFDEVRRRHPAARRVRGLSWLYHMRAYTDLFPPAYARSVAPAVGKLSLQGSSTWGQVLDYQQQIKPGVADLLLEGLDSDCAHAPWIAFPLQPLVASACIEEFNNWFC